MDAMRALLGRRAEEHGVNTVLKTGRSSARAPTLVHVGALCLLTSIIVLTGFGALPVSATSAAPTLAAPAEGAVLTNFAPTLTWTNPAGVTQYHLQVIPFNNDGPRVDVHIGSAGASFAIPAPPGWYGLLPDMTYTWRVRVSDAATFVNLDDASWSPWSERRFRTPAVISSAISVLTPAAGDMVTTLTPTIQWNNSRGDISYCEVQLSKDKTFNADPATAPAMIYSSLRHAGVTSPWSSYEVPASAPLEDNTSYYWRVRPRVQGDGTPLAWSTTYSFSTDTSATPKLSAEAITFGLSLAGPATCQIAGAGSSFQAAPTLTAFYYAFKYTGFGGLSITVSRDDGAAYAFSDGTVGPSGCYRNSNRTLPDPTPEKSFPLPPATYTVEVWHAGRKLTSGAITLTPASTLTWPRCRPSLTASMPTWAGLLSRRSGC